MDRSVQSVEDKDYTALVCECAHAATPHAPSAAGEIGTSRANVFPSSVDRARYTAAVIFSWLLAHGMPKQA